MLSSMGKGALIWADRSGAGFALLIVVFAFLIFLLSFTGAPPDHPFTLSDFGDMVIWTGKALLYAALPMWAVLRIIDFMFGGPRRRSQKHGRLTGGMG
jgi:hypothetical protein